ncbi:MAG TPA: signal peptidase I [Candidatus Saccharimonadales bacterium]|nr:signal peptidase I [Candidatus Saccharimonadales bacterium]
MKEFLKIIISIFFFILFGLVVFTLISSRFSVYGYHSYNVMTGSMTPNIPIGSLVLVHPGSYAVGDIITFNRGPITVTHRLVGQKNNQYITKGDANKIADPELVNKNDVIGKDLLIIPFIGKFVDYLKTAPGFIIFVAIPILIYIAFEIQFIKNEFEKEVKKKVLSNLNPAESHE